MKNITIVLKSTHIILSLIIVALSGCNSGAPIKSSDGNFNGGITQPIFDPIGKTSSEACSGFQGSLEMSMSGNNGQGQSGATDQIVAGSTVVWKINIASNGCTNLWAIQPNSASDQSTSQAKIPIGNQNVVYFQKMYRDPATNIQEVIQLAPLDTSQKIIGTPLTLTSKAFNVVAPAQLVPIQCQAQASPAAANTHYYTLAVSLNKLGKIVDIANLAGAGDIKFSFDPSTLPVNTAFQIPIRVDQEGPAVIQVHVADPTNVGVVMSCLATFFIPITVPPPPPPPVIVKAPTCNIHANSEFIVPNEPTSITMEPQGDVTSTCITFNGQTIANGVNVMRFNPNASGVLEGTVTGPGGVGRCQARLVKMVRRVVTLTGSTNGNQTKRFDWGGRLAGYRRFTSMAKGCKEGKNLQFLPNSRGFVIQPGCSSATAEAMIWPDA